MGRHKQKLDVRIPMMAGLILVVVLFFLYMAPSFGFDVTTTNDYVSLIPSFLFLIAGLYIVLAIGGMYSFPALSMVGVGMALLLKAMWDHGYITVQMMSGLSIAQIQFWCVIIGGLAGVLVSAATAKDKIPIYLS